MKHRHLAKNWQKANLGHENGVWAQLLQTCILDTVVMNKMRQFQDLGHNIVLWWVTYRVDRRSTGRNEARKPLSEDNQNADLHEQVFKVWTVIRPRSVTTRIGSKSLVQTA